MSQLTEHELYSIEDKIREWWKDNKIALYIHRDKSVISRLFARYPREWFSALSVIVERFKKKSNSTSHHARIEPWGELEQFILKKIKKRWSPEQIAESWKKEQREKWCKPNCCNWNYTLSKDTLYSWIYTTHPDLVKKYFRRKWKKYRHRKQEHILNPDKYQIQDRRMIDERPEIVDERKRIGDWEWDTVIWKDRSGAVLTLVDRKSGYLKIYQLERWKQAEWVTDTLSSFWKYLPKHTRKTLTFDNGREFAEHKMIEFETGVRIYFAHPYHSWERWTNENTNWLIRQYLPKKTDFSHITQEDLNKIEKEINSRPRKRLNYSTPYQVFWWKKKSCISD
jgi:IS30 family transposase